MDRRKLKAAAAATATNPDSTMMTSPTDGVAAANLGRKIAPVAAEAGAAGSVRRWPPAASDAAALPGLREEAAGAAEHLGWPATIAVADAAEPLGSLATVAAAAGGAGVAGER